MTSEQPTDLVRSAYEQWNSEGVAAIAPLLADDVELHDAPQMPDSDVWRGRDAVLARLEGVRSSVGGGSVAFEVVEPAGEDVRIAMRWTLASDSGRIDVGRVIHLVSVTDGKIARIRVFLDDS